MNLAKYFWMAGSLVISVLGIVHLLLTFYTKLLYPTDKKLVEDMNKVSPVISNELTIWKGWIGFNASHGAGILFIGVINCFLSFNDFALFQEGHFLFLFNIAIIGYYVFLAKKYWFTTPVIGVSIVFACYLISYLISFTN